MKKRVCVITTNIYYMEVNGLSRDARHREALSMIGTATLCGSSRKQRLSQRFFDEGEWDDRQAKHIDL